MESKIIFKEESYKIVGACFEVYNEKGNGFLEAVYQECLSIEFVLQGVEFFEQPPINLSYKSRELQKKYYPDFLCFNQVIVELKAVSTLTDEHRSQVYNYLRATSLKLGILVNFGSTQKLSYERILI